MGRILSYSSFLKTYKTRGYRLKHLEKYKSFFPIKSSPRLAGIIADLMGDGHLQGEPKWRIDFTSKDNFELLRFGDEMNKLFNIDSKIRKCTSNKYNTSNIAINCSPVARILFLCGASVGQKVLQSFSIPSWILKDKECFRRFCQRLFTCEGNINKYADRKIPQVRLEMWKEEKLVKNGESFLIDLQNHMKKYFNIDSRTIIQNRVSTRKDGIITKPIRLYVFGESVIKFYSEIGFEGAKQKSLKALLNK
jgi:hypothetical protein